jgi:hypothetical protein
MLHKKTRMARRKERVIDCKGFSFKYRKERQSMICLSWYRLHEPTIMVVVEVAGVVV